MEKEFKEDVFYTVTPSKDGRTCGAKNRCKFFERISGAHGDGLCGRVHGIIVHDAHCDLWEAAPAKKDPARRGKKNRFSSQ